MNKLFENWRTFVIKEANSYSEAETETGKEPQTLETLKSRLEDLLKKWPACKSEPDGMACKYHKDLEEVIQEYGGTGCPAGSHDNKEIEEACGDDISSSTAGRGNVAIAVLDET